MTTRLSADARLIAARNYQARRIPRVKSREARATRHGGTAPAGSWTSIPAGIYDEHATRG